MDDHKIIDAEEFARMFEFDVPVGQASSRRSSPTRGWAMFSPHGHVLITIARQPENHVRDLADQVGMSELVIRRILADLIDQGMIAAIDSGCETRYAVVTDPSLAGTSSPRSTATVTRLYGLTA